jgi:NAD(P)-dependent dehydrogenase (short-subunit alcohol dehydrogenase family)
VTALVTGSARGIGLAVCEALAARGDPVLAACRVPTPELEQLGVRVVPGIDVGSDDGVAGLGHALADERLDLVFCAAGINETTSSLDDVDTALMLREYDVNALGAVRVVRAALPHVREGGKIALVSTGVGASVSMMGPRTDNYGYRMSKSALNVFGAMLANELEPRRIAVAVLSPGLTDTDMARRAHAEGRLTRPLSEMMAPAAVAQLLLARIDELSPETSGRWIDRDGKVYV